MEERVPIAPMKAYLDIETSFGQEITIVTEVKEALAEDAEDLSSFDERADEALISYDEMVKRLRKDGRI